MKTLALGVIAAATLTAGSALAQDVTHGAAIAGLCLYSPQQVLATSTAGQSVDAGLQRLAQEVSAELQPYATDLEQRQTALNAAAGQLNGAQPSAALQQQAAEGQQRAQEFANLRSQRTNELAYTREMQIEAIGAAVTPIVQAVYQERGCSVLMSRSAALIFNPQMDLTETVLQRLNQALPSLSFNRMTVPPEVLARLQQQQQQQ